MGTDDERHTLALVLKRD